MKSAIFIIGLVLLAGCSETLEPVKPLIELEPDCVAWTVCASPQQTYNISVSECVEGLSPGQAQKFLDILVRNNVKMGSFKCTERIKPVRGELVIRQVDMP